MNDQFARARLLLIDDDVDFAADIASVLAAHCEVELAYTGEQGLIVLERACPDIVLLDLDFGQGMQRHGLDILERIRETDDPPAVIMLTGNKDLGMVVEAIKAGAFHYICKPPDPGELFNLINLALGDATLRRRIRILQEQILERDGTEVIADDPLMKRVFEDAAQVAPADTTVLVTGESGVGKDVVAAMIHRLSQRRDGPKIDLNCSSVPETLIESELFGHEKGAFTDAASLRRGKFELASGGTLFLDEIGEAPLTLQPKLLRALEKKQFERLGGEKVLEADVRFIAATNKDLREEIAAGRFREDLYYRLNVFRIHVPALRERPGDIIPLARHFLAKHAVSIRKDVTGFTPHAENVLLSYDWPGNVRELGNMIERAVVRSKGTRMGSGSFRFDDHPSTDALSFYPAAKSQNEFQYKCRYVTQQLEAAEGNVTVAAEISGVMRQAFQKMMRDCNILSETFRR